MSIVTQDHSYGGPTKNSEKNTNDSNPDKIHPDEINKITEDSVNIVEAVLECNPDANNTSQTSADSEVQIDTAEGKPPVVTTNPVKNSLQSLITASEITSVADSLLKRPQNSQVSNTSSKETVKKTSISSMEKEGNEESYHCGVCKTIFGAMIDLHEHMVNVEKVKSYKYSIETRTAEVEMVKIQVKADTEPSQQPSGKKRGRKRKQVSSNSPENGSDKKKSSGDQSKDEQGRNMSKKKDKEINASSEDESWTKQPLMKFEKTVENKSEDSAFFDPIAHSYGTRRRSFLNYKDLGKSPDKPPRTNHAVKSKERNLVNNKERNHTTSKSTGKRGRPRIVRIEADSDSHASPDEVIEINRDEEQDKQESENNTESINDESTLPTNNIEIVKPDGTIVVIDDGQSEDKKSSVDSNSDDDGNDDGSFEAEDDMDEDYNGKEVKEKKTKRPYSKSRIECEVCGKVFRRCMIERHMVKHSNIREWQCDICEKFYKTKMHRDEHKKKIHFLLKSFKCKTCNKVLKNKLSADKHKTLHLLRGEPADMEELDKYEAQQSKQTPLDKTDYTNKQRSDQNVSNKPSEANIHSLNQQDTRETAGTDSIRAEQQLVDRTDTCNNNQKESSIDGEQAGDVNVAGDTEAVQADDPDGQVSVINEPNDTMDYYNCNKCVSIFISKDTLHNHKVKQHAVKKEHPCTLCPKVFYKLYLLKDHIESCHENKSFECNVCNAVLSSDRSLWAHKGRHLSETDPHFSEEVVKTIQEEHKERMIRKTNAKFVICTICGKEVMSKRFLRHMVTHNKSRDFECEICHKRYTAKRYVRDHIVKSHGTKTSFCDICGRTFKGTQYLEKHKQIHGPKDKICDICGKGFTTEFYLKVHMVTHAETKQHKCSLCDAAFKHKSRLDIHMMERHSKGQDRPCKHCGELFPSRQKARLHERRVHEGFTTPTRSRRGLAMRTKVKLESDSQDLQYTMVLPQHKMDQSEAEESVEQIIEIPENSQQCQLMILPNGVIKVLNVVEGEGGSAVSGEDDNYTIQYVTEDGQQILDEGDPDVQYIEVNESEFKLMTEGRDPQVEYKLSTEEKDAQGMTEEKDAQVHYTVVTEGKDAQGMTEEKDAQVHYTVVMEGKDAQAEDTDMPEGKDLQAEDKVLSEERDAQVKAEEKNI